MLRKGKRRRFHGCFYQSRDRSSAEKTEVEPPKVTLKSIDEVAKEVIKGKWATVLSVKTGSLPQGMTTKPNRHV